MITDKTAQALRVIKDCKSGVTPSSLAHLLWPDSEGYKHSHKCGAYGSRKGGMMAFAAGGYLGRLRRRGLTVYRDIGYSQWFHFLTAQGEAALVEWEENHVTKSTIPF